MPNTAHPLRPSTRPRRDTTGIAVLAVGSLVALVLALVAPNLTQGSGMSGMSMTHYMGLLSVRQPWNLLLFMALPVILAETLAITELVILPNPHTTGTARTLSRWAGLIGVPVWVFITVHLVVHAVAPLSVDGGWRGPADIVAVLAYLLGSLPMLGIGLVEAGLIGHGTAEVDRLHVVLVATFLVVSHVAMIFGMLDPTVLGWKDPSSMGHDMSEMPGMAMPSDAPTATPTAQASSTPMTSMSGMDMPMDHSTMPMPTPTGQAS